MIWLVPLALLLVLLVLAVPLAIRRIAGHGKPGELGGPREPREALDDVRAGSSPLSADWLRSSRPLLSRGQVDTVIVAGSTLRMRAVARTFPGRATGNADVYLIQNGMIAVADGGSPVQLGARVASLALSATVVALADAPGATEERLRHCVANANRTVRAAAAADPRLARQASTLDCLLLEPGMSRLHYAHVGNGAIWYWPVDSAPRALTTPHSSGWVLLRGVGMVEDLLPDVGVLELAPGDRILVATAGLSHELTQETIIKLPGPADSPDACLERLADMAATGGSGIVVDFIPASPEPAW